MRGREEDPISIVMDSREETSWAFKGVDGVNTVTSKKKKTTTGKHKSLL